MFDLKPKYFNGFNCIYIELYLIYDTCNSSFESWSCSQLQLSYIFMKFHWMFSRHSNFDKLLKYPICHLFRGSKIQCLWIPQSTLIIDPRWSIQNDWYYYCIIVLAAFFVSMTGYSTCTRRTIRWSRWRISLKQVWGWMGFTPSNIWNRVRMRRGPDPAVRHGRDPARHQLGHGRRAEHLQAAGD